MAQVLKSRTTADDLTLSPKVPAIGQPRRLLLPPFENGFAHEVLIGGVPQQCRQGREIARLRQGFAEQNALSAEASAKAD